MTLKSMSKGSAMMLALALGPSLAAAEDVSALAGKRIYDERCVVCHGASGKGDGPVGALFAIRPGDLSKLQGEHRFFPYLEVLAKIDGRDAIAAHGSEMPIWGEYFMQDALEDRGINPKDAATIVSGRLASLIFYLATLQSDD